MCGLLNLVYQSPNTGHFLTNAWELPRPLIRRKPPRRSSGDDLHALQHRPRQAARLDIEIADRFGKKVRPREWFLLPPSIIGEAVARLKDGSIVNYRYDPDRVALAPIAAKGT
jgi:hypothetical protein